MKKINKKIIMLFIIISLISIITVSYAIYNTEITLTYTTNTGETICDIDVDYNESYKVNGIPYFYVTVTNYNEEETLTDTNVEYSLTITNNSSSSNRSFCYSI